MSDSAPTDESVLQRTKLTHENRKLLLEIKLLERPWYKRKGFWGGAGAVLASAVALFAQHYLTSIKTERSLLKAEQERIALEKEVSALKTNVAELKSDARRYESQRSEVVMYFQNTRNVLNVMTQLIKRAQLTSPTVPPDILQGLQNNIDNLIQSVDARRALEQAETHLELGRRAVEATEKAYNADDYTKRQLEESRGKAEAVAAQLKSQARLLGQLSVQFLGAPVSEQLSNQSHELDIVVATLSTQCAIIDMRISRGEYKRK